MMPVLARVYLIPLDRQQALTLEQFRFIRADYERLTAEED